MQVSSIGNSLGFGNTTGSLKGHRSPPPLAGKALTDLDTDGDGTISEAELQKALGGTASADGTSASSDQANKLFKKIDADGDGTISSDEWNSFQQKMKSHHHHYPQGVDAMDASQDAASNANATQSMQSLVAQLYKSIDTDGNGQLSQSEVVNGLSGLKALL